MSLLWPPSSALSPFPRLLVFSEQAPYQAPLHEQQSVRRVASPDAPLVAGCYMRVHVHPKRFPRCYSLDWAQHVVAHTDDFVVVDKPAGVPVSLPQPLPYQYRLLLQAVQAACALQAAHRYTSYAVAACTSFIRLYKQPAHGCRREYSTLSATRVLVLCSSCHWPRPLLTGCAPAPFPSGLAGGRHGRQSGGVVRSVRGSRPGYAGPPTAHAPARLLHPGLVSRWFTSQNWVGALLGPLLTHLSSQQSLLLRT